jgi:hypothetical protein
MMTEQEKQLLLQDLCSMYKPYTDILYSDFGKVVDFPIAHHFDYRGLIPSFASNASPALEANKECIKIL